MEDARFQELAVNYEDTVIRAAQEVEDAMVDFLQAQDAVVFLTDAVKASKRSVELSLIQYREGLVDYQRVLDTQRFLADQQDQQVSTSGSVVTNLIAAYKSLGGGWQLREGDQVVPPETLEEMRQRTDWGDLLSPDAIQVPIPEEERGRWRKPDW